MHLQLCACEIQSCGQNIGLRKHYWKNVWDLFDFILLPLTLVDIIIVEGIHLDTYGVLQLIRIMRLLRLIRTVGLIKVHTCDILARKIIFVIL